MTITIEIPDELTKRLSTAGIPPHEAKKYAIAALSDAADSAEIRQWWDSLSEADRQRQRELAEASSVAGRAGRSNPAREVVQRIRDKRSRQSGR